MKILIILSLAYILFVHNLGTIALWDPDEPRQAIMAREMMERKDYIHPYLNGRPYLEKPPFFSWMIIVASKVRGALDELSSRMPSAISATLLLLVTCYMGRILIDSQVGFLSAIVLATNYQFLSNARESVMDMTFAFFIGLAVFFSYLSIVKEKRWHLILSFIPASLATLTKGPAGLIIPACTIFIYLLIKKEFKRFIVPLIIGCVLSLVISSIWFLLAGEEYWREFILRQNLARYTNAFDHIESLYYYFHKLFFNFLPWSILLPFSIYHAFRKGYWLPLVWFIFTFLFFELSMSKRAIYLLSLYPACALLCGVYIRDCWSWLIENKWTNILLKCFALLIALIPLVSIVVLYTLPYSAVNIFREGPSSLYIYVVILFITGGMFFYVIMRKATKLALSLFIFYLAFAGYFYNAYYMPLMDRTFKSPRLITDELRGFKKDMEIYTYGFNSAGLIFYAGKPIHPVFDMKEIKDTKSDILLIVEDKPSAPIREELNTRFLPVKKARYEKEHYTFYVKRDGK
jgi:4-amino-4-deoxy-L-arabinose transferase-like glycosyltransferase